MKPVKYRVSSNGTPVRTLRNLLPRALKSMRVRFWHFTDRKLHKLYGWHVAREVNAMLHQAAQASKHCDTKILVTSYSNKAIPSSIVSSQDAVLSKIIALPYQWRPLRSRSRAMHYQFIDAVLAKCFENFDYLVLLDVDCVPYSQSALDELVSRAEEGALVGVEQISPGHATGHYYVSPVACCISKQVFDRIGRPSAVQNLDGDVMESFTFCAERAGINVSLVRVTDVVGRKLWKFPDGRDFGIGTVCGAEGKYMFFHNFCSSTKSNKFLGTDHTKVFIDFCSAILNGHG